MAILDATNRARVMAQLQRIGLSFGAALKTDLATAVQIIDDDLDGIFVTLNAKLPVLIRALPTNTKLAIFYAVVARRCGFFRADED